MLQERPFLLPFLAMALGLVFSDLTGFTVTFHILIPLFVCFALASLIVSRVPVAACACLFFFCWGLHALSPWKQTELSNRTIVRYASALPVTVEGTVQGRPNVSPSGSRLVMRVEHVMSGRRFEPVSGTVILYVAEGDVDVTRGDRIRCTTRISVPRLLGLPGEFDYGRYLGYQGISATGRVASQDAIVLIRGAAEDSIRRRADLVARQLGNFIRESIPDPSVSSVLTALLIGDQKRIPADLADAYTRAGVNHILSVSGFHVGIIAYFIVSLTLLVATRSESLALRLNLRRVVLILSVPAMVFYLLLTGSAPATARSVAMMTLFVVALCAEREIDPVNTLLLSAFILLAIHPPTLFDVSFQLSFLALWGIVVLVPPVMMYAARIKHNWQRSLIQFVAASCAATCATAVPALFIFSQTTLNGILANFLIVPLLGYGAVLVGFCALPFVYLYPPVAHLLLVVASWIVEMSNGLIGLFSRLPVLKYYGVTALDMFLFISVLSLLTFVKSRSLKIFFSLAAALVVIASHLHGRFNADGRLHISMLSVGQSESLFLRLPDGATMLIDGGGYLHDTGRDFGERVLAPALHKLGADRIDYMLLTHVHPDHLGGLPYIARTIPVGIFLESASGGIGDQYQRLCSTLKQNRATFRSLKGGDRLDLSGGVTLKVLSPLNGHQPGGISDGDMGVNEESLVFRLEYGSFSMLFTADAGNSAESRMISEGALLKATALKVGHHGSRYSTSEEFLDAVNPDVAFISAGYGNTFRLPSPQTLARLEHRRIKTYRTDRDGTVKLVTNGKEWSVATPYRRE